MKRSGSSDDDEFFDAFEDQSQLDASKKKQQCKLTAQNGNNQMPLQEKPNIQNGNQRPTGNSKGVIFGNTSPIQPQNDAQQNSIPKTINQTQQKQYQQPTSHGPQNKQNTSNLQQILEKLDEESNSTLESNFQSNSQSISSKLKPLRFSEQSSYFDKTSENDQSSCSDLSTRSATAKQSPQFEEIKSTDGGKSLKASKSQSFSGTLGTQKSSSGENDMNVIPKITKTNAGKRKSFDDLKFMRENVKRHEKEKSDFSNLVCLQILSNPEIQQTDKNGTKNGNPTWIARFSPNNKFLAIGGASGILKVYKVTVSSPVDSNNTTTTKGADQSEDFQDFEQQLQILDPKYDDYIKHTFDIIDISWYKDSTKLLTASIDKKVILWSLKRQTFLKIFDHSDIVSCVSFHPLVDEFFVSGCFDKIARVWDINEEKVVDWVQLNDYITALTFSPDKKHLLIGNTKGVVKIYLADQGKLKFYQEIVCKNSFTWGRLNKQGRKVTEIQFIEEDEFLVVTNDSRMRLIGFNDFTTKVKYKGHKSGKLHIQTSFNYEKQMILSGSEDGKVFIWNKETDFVPQINPLYTRRKKNRNLSYEYFKPFPNVNTPCAIWVPYDILKKFKENIAATYKNIYIDAIMILISFDSDIKVVGNLIELDA